MKSNHILVPVLHFLMAFTALMVMALGLASLAPGEATPQDKAAFQQPQHETTTAAVRPIAVEPERSDKARKTLAH